jgi:lipopolysaccharide assembly outer membrane protein LptD (OstA)
MSTEHRAISVLRALLATVVIGMLFSQQGSAQSAIPPGTHLRSIFIFPSTAISAKDMQQDWSTNTLHARGQVRIETATSILSADEADIQNASTITAVNLDIELRGNVHVQIAASTGR